MNVNVTFYYKKLIYSLDRKCVAWIEILGDLEYLKLGHFWIWRDFGDKN